MNRKVQWTFTGYYSKHTNCIKLYCIKHESLRVYFEVIHMLEVRNVDMMSLINLFPVGWLPMHYFMSTKLYSQWLPYSIVNLTLFNMLEIHQLDRWAQHTIQFHAWVIKCMQTRVKAISYQYYNIGIENTEKTT